MYITKTQIKAELKEELKCPQDFIDRINKSGWIDKMKEAITNDDHTTANSIKNDIYDEYKFFCKTYDLNIEEDNRD